MHGYLADLVRELRNQIYCEFIAAETTVICFTIDAGSSADGRNDAIYRTKPDSGLPATCKVFRAEFLEACKRNALHHIKTRFRIGS